MSKRVVVLGAGVAGLTTAILLRKKGYDVTLIEKNDHCGGLCSGYFVNGHYIDHCIHWLMGTKEGSLINSIWKEIGGLTEDTNIIKLPTLGTFIYNDDKVIFHKDLEKAEKEWSELSPVDKEEIHNLFATIKNVAVLMSKVEKTRVDDKSIKPNISKILHLIKSIKMSRSDYANKFQHPAIRQAIKYGQTGANNMFFFMDYYGVFALDDANVPEGGAYYLTRRLEEKFRELSGNLLLNTSVNEIITYKHKAVAVDVGNKIIEGDVFISCIDPQYTLHNLLKDKYKVLLYRRLKNNLKDYPISSTYSIYFTVENYDGELDVPTGININPIRVGSKNIDFMLVRPYSFDKCFVKDNKTVFTIFIDQDQDDYFFYKSLGASEYKKEVDRINLELIEIFKAKFPKYQNNIEFLTYFSPIELEKWSNTSYGALQGFSFAKNSNFYLYNGKIKGLKNMYMGSQWSRSIGGTPTAILTGDKLSKIISKKNKIEK